MITIPVIYIFVIYIGIILLFGLTASLSGRRPGKVVIKDMDLFTCPVCAYCYIINNVDKIHKCPQCESLNRSHEDTKALRKNI